jgi:hypothetical protein
MSLGQEVPARRHRPMTTRRYQLVALAIVLSAVVLLLTVLVAGLLRSHADILKALHELGVGVGEPEGAQNHIHGGSNAADSVPVPITMGPPLPGERSSTSAPTVAGVAPNGDALAVSVAGGGHLTLLAFLSSGCATCAGFWTAFQRPDDLGLPAQTRLVVVTKGPEMEIPSEVASQSRSGLTVVMSTDAWSDYEVPGSPFFVLVDGNSGRRIGEGVANHFHQVVELVRRAEVDAQAFTVSTKGRAFSDGLDGPERELANDRELIGAGILPGDASLYPSSLDDLYGPNPLPESRAPTGRSADDPSRLSTDHGNRMRANERHGPDQSDQRSDPRSGLGAPVRKAG